MNEIQSYQEICPREEGNGFICAPNAKYEDGSCITVGILKNMVETYNEEYPNNSINIDDSLEILNGHKFKQELVKQLENRLGSDQLKWIKEPFVNKMENIRKLKLKQYTFKPDGPQSKFEWLNQLHIDDVMKQYELKYPDFLFLGSVPIDFYEINYNDIAEIDIKKDLIDKGRTKIAMIINLDTSKQPGSHWVSLYAHYDVNKHNDINNDPPKILIYFYDSYGMKPAKRIRKYMRLLARVAEKLNIKYIDLSYTKRQHQEENSECGMYSLNFILRLLNGETFQEIESKRVPDAVVNECRTSYFKIKKMKN
jgi:hypothetical protein